MGYCVNDMQAPCLDVYASLPLGITFDMQDASNADHPLAFYKDEHQTQLLVGDSVANSAIGNLQATCV